MLYKDIDRFMKETGLAKDPAFENLNFLTEPIPKIQNKTILGLYFPEGEQAGRQFGYLPPSTIILPPDADEETLKHELGHRHGHFYYNDIGEPYAENYRKRLNKEPAMMAMRVAAQSQVCQGCPGKDEGLCDYCEYGNYGIEDEARRAKLPAPFVKAFRGWEKIGTFAPLASDYSYSLTVSPPLSLVVGSNIAVTVAGRVTDLHAGDIDNWQIAVAIAQVDSHGNPDPTNRIAKSFGSDLYGIAPSTEIYVPYSKVICICDTVLDTTYNPHFGVMPNAPLTVWVELFASHSTSTPWDWSMWNTAGPS